MILNVKILLGICDVKPEVMLSDPYFYISGTSFARPGPDMLVANSRNMKPCSILFPVLMCSHMFAHVGSISYISYSNVGYVVGEMGGFDV